MTKHEAQERLWKKLETRGCVCDGLGMITINVPINDPLFGVAFHCICQRDRIRGIRNKPRTLGDTMPNVDHLAPDSFAAPHYNAAMDALSCLMDSTTVQGKPGIFLWGRTGIGKSSLAAFAFKQLAATRFRGPQDALWINYGHRQSSFIAAVQACYDAAHRERTGLSPADVIREASEVPFLVIDDFGSPYTDGREKNDRIEIIEAVLDDRWRAYRPTIVTSNLSPNQVLDQFGDRAYSRLFGLCHAIEIAAPADLRVAQPAGRVFWWDKEQELHAS